MWEQYQIIFSLNEHQQMSDVFAISKLIHKHILQFQSKYTIVQLLT